MKEIYESLPKATFRFDPDGRAFVNGHSFPDYCRRDTRKIEVNHAAADPVVEKVLVEHGVDGSSTLFEQADAILSTLILATRVRRQAPVTPA